LDKPTENINTNKEEVKEKSAPSRPASRPARGPRKSFGRGAFGSGEGKEFVEKVVSIKRVAKVVKEAGNFPSARWWWLGTEKENWESDSAKATRWRMP